MKRRAKLLPKSWKEVNIGKEENEKKGLEAAREVEKRLNRRIG